MWANPSCGSDEPLGHARFCRYRKSNFRASTLALRALEPGRAEPTLRPGPPCVIHDIMFGMNSHHGLARAARITQGRPEAAGVNLGSPH